DCGRVLDLGYSFCDELAKLIPVQPGKTITLEMAREMEPLLAERERKEHEVRELLELGEKLEGMVRNVGMHAGGVLIAPGRLTDFCPLYAAEGTNNVISQLDKDDVEKIGLVKFDFLGLTTLTILDWAERSVRAMGAPTFGIMVYQEQVMQIAQVIGGYTLGGADLLRRAMGKKKPEEMAQQRDIFVAGAEKNGLSRSKATQLFDLMEKFAGYGFNKSHAAAYALLAYQTAYMKAHHRSAFLAANLSAVMNDTDKVRQFYEDALANAVAILPPDINASDYRFTPVDGQRIRYGLGAVRGTGEAAINSIVQARREAPFTDLFDFCRRVDKRMVNRRVVEALVRAGAFDALDVHRSRLLA